MCSVSSSNLFVRAAVRGPPNLSQETIIIIILSASIAGIVIIYSLYRVIISRIASSNATPLPPVQQLAHHRARLQAEMRTESNYPSVYLAAPATFPTISSAHGSKTSLLDSEVGEEHPAPLPSRDSRIMFPSPSSSSSIRSAQRLSPNDRCPSRTRSVSSLGTSASRRTRLSTVYGAPHGPFSHVQIVLPTPLATTSRHSMFPENRHSYIEPSETRRTRTLSFVDQWVTAPNVHESDFSDILEHSPSFPPQTTT